MEVEQQAEETVSEARALAAAAAEAKARVLVLIVSILASNCPTCVHAAARMASTYAVLQSRPSLSNEQEATRSEAYGEAAVNHH